MTPAAPAVTADDVLNTVTGMAVGMEYNLDGVGYVPYVAATFNAINFAGVHSLLVRVVGAGINPAGAVTTLNFTTNPVTPLTPIVAVNDTVATTFNTAINGINVLANDTGAGIALTGILINPVGGVFSVAGGMINFTPTPGFSGPASVTYEMGSGLNRALGTLTVNVGPDLLAPVSTTITGVVNGSINTTAVTPTWTDAVGTTSTATLDGAPYTKGTAISVNGAHVLVVTTVKTANGLTSLSTVNFTVDTLAPVSTTITGVVNGSTNAVAVTPTWTDAVGTTSTATLNGAPYTKGTAISVNGAHVLVVTTVKTANGLTSLSTVNFTVDTLAPVSTTITGVVNGSTNAVAVTPTWTDAVGTTSTATLNGAPFVNGTPVSTSADYVLIVTTTKA